ncbi:MAG: glycosyltransferase family 39 protein [Deltaproteobacteria bacterium]|nr:glycosyltransferase family 39 protein [Deltaproteobacteria bacterium]
MEPDEGRNAEVAREILLLNNWTTPHYNFVPRLDKPVFFYWPAALSYKAFGVSEWSARLPSAFAGLACIALIYQFARAFLGPWKALWSGLILATSAEYFSLARIAHSEMVLAFFMALSLCCFYSALSAERLKAQRALGFSMMYLAIGISTLIKGPVGIALPGAVILGYLLLSGKWHMLREKSFVFGSLILVAAVVPAYAWAEFRNPGYLQYLLVEENLLRFFTHHFDRGGPWYSFFAIAAVGFLPWTLLLPNVVKHTWKKRSDDKTLFLLAWTVLPLLIFSFSKTKLPHYILIVYPALAMLTASAVHEIPTSSLRTRAWIPALPWFMLIIPLAYAALALSQPTLLPHQLRLPFQAFQALRPPIVALWPVLLLSLCLAIWIWTRAKEDAPFVGSCVGFFAWFLLIHELMVPLSSFRSSKEMAVRAAEFTRPSDQILIYDTYLSSLPFYLSIDRPIGVVWSGRKSSIMGSFYVAEKMPPPAGGYGRVLYTFDQFSHLWARSDRRLLVFVKEKNLARLSEGSGVQPTVLLKVGEIVLATNRGFNAHKTTP